MAVRLLMFAVLVFVAACGEGEPAPDADYFRGKTLTYIVATDAGGGYDAYGRLIARYMEKHLPGTRVIVKNVPGAGHIIGANTIHAAPPDGLTVGTFNTGLIYSQLLQLPGVRFDLAKMSWIGKASEEIRVVLLARNTPYKSFDDLLRSDRPVKFAASQVGTSAYLDTRILDAVVPDLDLQTVSGYSGSEAELSMIRGDVVGQVGIASSLEPFVKNGHGFFALAMTDLAARRLPGVPSVKAYVKTADGLRLLGLLETVTDLGRFTAGPPGIPAPILTRLRQAHDDALADPELVAEAARLNLPIAPGGGEFVEHRIVEALAQTPETIALLRAAALPR